MYFNENISMILKQEMQRTKTEKKEQDLKGPYNIDNIFDIWNKWPSAYMSVLLLLSIYN